MTNLTARCAEIVLMARGAALASNTMELLKLGFLDWMGVTIAGKRADATQVALRILSSSLSSHGTATAIPAERFVNAGDAVWLNGIAAHALDFDDTLPINEGWNYHPSAATIAAALGTAQDVHASGRELLQAYAVGISVASELGSHFGASSSARGWHTISVIGVFAAAAASGYLRQLEFRQLYSCFGIAAAMAGGLRRNIGSMAKALQAGNAARSGYVAAELAGFGFTGGEAIFDGDFGVLDLFGGSAIGRTSTSPRSLNDIELAFKPYACCRATHTAIEAALAIHQRIGSKEIKKITCYTTDFNRRFARFDYPNSILEAKFSIPYGVCLALLFGTIKLGDFERSRYADANLNNMIRMTRVKTIEDSNQANFYSEIRVELSGSETVSAAREIPRGEPSNPISKQELIAKYLDCTSGILEKENSLNILSRTLSIDAVDDTSTFFSGLNSH